MRLSAQPVVIKGEVGGEGREPRIGILVLGEEREFRDGTRGLALPEKGLGKVWRGSGQT